MPNLAEPRTRPARSVRPGVTALYAALLLFLAAAVPATGAAAPGADLRVRAAQAWWGLRVRAATAILRERPSGTAPVRAACAEVWAPPGDRAAAAVAARVRSILLRSGAALGLTAAQVDAACRAHGPVRIVFFADASEARTAYGLPPGARVEGVYRDGVVGVLGPATWGDGAEGLERFLAYGALTHELTHWLADAVARGNLPAWLSEGLAQRADWEVTGFLLEPPGVATPYSLADLERRFDGLEPLRAYRQALLLVLAIEGRGGEGSLGALLQALGEGMPFERALARTTGLDRPALERAVAGVDLRQPVLGAAARGVASR